MLAALASIQTADALVVAPLKARVPMTSAPTMQFDFFKKSKPEPAPEPAKASKPISTSGGGLFGNLMNKQSRKGDGGMTTSGFRRPVETPTKGKAKKKVVPEPDKWIEGRSGPMINPEWTAWSKNR